MKKLFLALLCLPHVAHADRITQMNQTDLCTYSARMQVAGYYYFEQGKARADVVIKWHGDETQNEIEFVNRLIDDAYAWLMNARASGAQLLPAQAFGDLVYEACMNGKSL